MGIETIRIHPGIGVARVGNSPEHFIGPEHPDQPPPESFKDDKGRVRGQGARFRLMGYDAAGRFVREVTAADARITWRVRLGNAKAADHRVNPEESYRDMYLHGDAALTVSGSDGVPAPAALGGRITFRSGVATPKGFDVRLGELRPDVARGRPTGRLVVLGGAGRAGCRFPAVDNQNCGGVRNPGWFDDTSDGPVGATVVLDDGIVEAVGAWVVVAPPCYAPHFRDVVTLGDRLLELAVAHGWVGVDEDWPLVDGVRVPSYVRHVDPVLRAVEAVRYVNHAAPLAEHEWRHPVTGDEERAAVFRLLMDSVTLTGPQRTVLAEWARGRFSRDRPPTAPAPADVDHAALAGMSGAAFRPGVEVGEAVLDPTRYYGSDEPSDPLRLRHDRNRPGALTEGLGLPWQAAFRICGDLWWPVTRPDHVLHPETSAYQAWDRSVGDNAAMVAHWHRGGFVVPDGPRYVERERDPVAVVTPRRPQVFLHHDAGQMAFDVTSPEEITLVVHPSPDGQLTVRPAAAVVPPTGEDRVRTVWFGVEGRLAELVPRTVEVACPRLGEAWHVQVVAALPGLDDLPDPLPDAPGTAPVLTTEVAVVPGTVLRVPFQATEVDTGLEVALVGGDPRSVHLLLQSPTGALIGPETEGAHWEARGGRQVYRFPLPARLRPDRAEGPGTWHVLVDAEQAREAAPCALAVRVRSAIDLDVERSAGRLVVRPRGPVAVQVWAEFTGADGEVRRAEFAGDGEVDLAGAGAGRVRLEPGGADLPGVADSAGVVGEEGRVVPANTGPLRADLPPGSGGVRVLARGTSPLGYPFQREYRLADADVPTRPVVDLATTASVQLDTALDEAVTIPVRPAVLPGDRPGAAADQPSTAADRPTASDDR
ncbi:LodA/GoxA family CTQ-dependent oxidase [Saccharothrix obliqua]|uniref:LodA/GoxA family CTQ-dependent oxidase n=1 Tax=Saccharothrix obliqua TaxID=2861747 RepID=UPI001C5EDB96|nr:LodA/GoxA family CTQ-dependent oxidase [Saccharothrix obliqua]MBW4718153.1 LodA/GoxA family CTQ-dependent oxidase [Saccharothrix obliqua]